MTKGVFEVFAEAAKQETDEQKAAFLSQHGQHYAIKSIIQGCFHPNVKFLLPEGLPPFQQADPVEVETRLYSLAKRFDIFVEGGRPVASQTKREMLFIELLESIHPKDADILNRMKDKKDPVDGITQKVAHLAFPDLVPEPVETPVVEETVVEKKPKRATKSKTTAKKRTKKTT